MNMAGIRQDYKEGGQNTPPDQTKTYGETTIIYVNIQ
jgi:hypothetical protein